MFPTSKLTDEQVVQHRRAGVGWEEIMKETGTTYTAVKRQYDNHLAWEGARRIYESARYKDVIVLERLLPQMPALARKHLFSGPWGLNAMGRLGDLRATPDSRLLSIEGIGVRTVRELRTLFGYAGESQATGKKLDTLSAAVMQTREGFRGQA